MFRSRSPNRQSARSTARSGGTGGRLDRSLEQWIVDYSPLIFHVAFGILHDPGLAEDVVQETMIKAWRNQRAFRGDSSPKTWLVRIGRNTAIDTLRRQRELITTSGDLPETVDRTSTGDTEQLTEAREELSVLAIALRQLDELSRTIVILREIESMSYEEIAEILEVPVSTVKTRLLRARRALAQEVTSTTAARVPEVTSS